MAVTAYEDKVYLAHLPDGPIRVLEGTAALIWSRALAVPRSDLDAVLAHEVDTEPGAIHAEVSAFVDALILEGLLIEDGEG